MFCKSKYGIKRRRIIWSFLMLSTTSLWGQEWEFEISMACKFFFFNIFLVFDPQCIFQNIWESPNLFSTRICHLLIFIYKSGYNFHFSSPLLLNLSTISSSTSSSPSFFLSSHWNSSPFKKFLSLLFETVRNQSIFQFLSYSIKLKFFVWRIDYQFDFLGHK